MSVLMLTKAFPWLPGEHFITPEVDEWAASGAELTLMPFNRGEQLRPLPDGVAVDDRLTRIPAAARRRALLRAAVSPLLWREWASLVRHRKLTPTLAVKALTALRGAYLVRDALVQRAEQVGVADVAYSYWFDVQTFGALLARDAGAVRRVVSRAHRYDLYEEVAPDGFHPWKRHFGPRLDVFAPISRRGLDYARDRYRTSASQSRFSPLGTVTDVALTRPDDDRVTIFSFSNLVPVKHVERVRSAVVELARRHPDRPVRWLHAGDGPLREELFGSSATDQPDNLTITWLGHLDATAIEALFADEPIDLLCNSSDSEGVPVSIMEAMAHGVPVVATDVGATGEVVGELGRLVSTDLTAQQWADVIDYFLPAARSSELRTACRDSIRQHWDARSNHRAFIDALTAAAAR